MALPATDPLVTPRHELRRRLQPSEHRALLVIADAAALTAGVLVSLWTWSITAGFPFGLEFISERAVWFLAIPAWLSTLAPSYNLRTARSVGRTAAALAQALGLLLVVYLALYFYAPRLGLPRLVALYVLWEGALLTLGWRLTYIWYVANLHGDKRVLIIGATAAGRAALRLIREASVMHTTVVGFVDDDPTLWNSAVDGIPIAGGSDRLAKLVKELGVAEIVLAAPHEASGTLLAALGECQEKGIDVVPMSQVHEDLLRRVPVTYLESGWLFTSFAEGIRVRDASRIAKRLVDIVGALAGLLVLLPMAPLIALAIWLESGRPILFRQVRVGRGGSTFELVKFRTMRRDAEEDGLPQWAGARDPRVTKVGRFLRLTRLDELPNFLSVLRGEMSLVGPRPERPEFVSLLERRVPLYRSRLIVRPGLTGWAQVNSPYGDSINGTVEKLEYDLYYLKYRSFLFDLLILARTVGTVVRLKGR